MYACFFLLFGTYKMCNTREGMMPKVLPKISAFNINGKTTNGGKEAPWVAKAFKISATPRPGDQFTRFREGILRRSPLADFNGDASCFPGDTEGGRVREAWQRRPPERPREIERHSG